MTPPRACLQLLFLALPVALPAFPADNSSISGKVLDPQNRAIPQASVTLFSTTAAAHWNTQTGLSGTYEFANVSPGNYLIEVQAPGFSSYRVANLHITSAGALTLNLPLAVGTVQEEVSVTASGTPQTVDQIAKALTVVDNTAIQQRQDYSLLDAIRLTPGLRVEQQGGPGAFSEILIRGLRPEDTAVLVDGLRLRDASGTQADASSLLEDFLIPDVSRIEILRGAGSSLYGTDAIGGVVNVITAQGGGPTHGSVDLQGGSLGLFQGSALIAGGPDHDRIQYSLGLMNLNVSSGIGGYNPARIWSLQSQAAFRLSSNSQLIARFLGSTSFIAVNTSPQAIADYPNGIVPARTGDSVAAATYIPAQNDPDSTRDGRFETGALTLSGQPIADFGYKIDYQIVNSSRTYGNGPAGPGYQPAGNTDSNYNGRIQTITSQANYQPAKYSLITAGYEFENENYYSFSSDTSAPADISSVNVTQSSNTAFIQDQSRLFGDRLYLSAAFRSQFFELQQPNFSPSAQAPYQAVHYPAPQPAYTGDASIAYSFRRHQTKLRAHVGRGYRAPSLFERFGAGYDSFFGYSVYGDPELTPEQSIAVDTGIDQSLLNNKLHLSATYFYTHLQRVIYFDTSGLINPLTDPFGRSIGYLNTTGGLARGVEFNASWAAASALTVSGSYTYTDAREETPIVPNVYRSFNTPQDQFSAFVVQQIGARMFVDFALNASNSYLAQLYSNFSSGAFRFPGYKRGDLGLSYRLPIKDTKTIRLFAKAENIFDRFYYESGFPTPGITARGGIQLEF